MRGWIVGAAMMVASAGVQAEVTVDSAEHESDYNTYSLTLTNGYDEAVSRISVTLTYTTPGRSVPWAVQPQTISIPGGIEPGETRTLEGYSADRSVKQADDKPVEVVVSEFVAFDPDGDPLD